MLLVIFFSMPEEFLCSIGVHQVASLYLCISCFPACGSISPLVLCGVPSYISEGPKKKKKN